MDIATAAQEVATELAGERFDAAEALCRATDRAVQVTPLGVSLGPVSARHAELARQGVAAAEARYVRTTVAATASARAAASFRSSPVLATATAWILQESDFR